MKSDGLSEVVPIRYAQRRDLLSKMNTVPTNPDDVERLAAVIAATEAEDETVEEDIQKLTQVLVSEEEVDGDVERLTKIFGCLDQDHNGRIDIKELEQACKKEKHHGGLAVARVH